MMKHCSATSTIIALLLWSSCSLAASISFAPAADAQRQVKANDFVTVGFAVVSQLDREHSFLLSAQTEPGATLVSALKAFSLKPGEADIIPLTFHISSDVKDQQLIRVDVAISSQQNPALTATAALSFVITSRICATIAGFPEPVQIENQKASDVIFRIINCGDSKETFDIQIEPGFGMELRTNPRTASLDSGAEKDISFSIFPTNHRAEYASTVRLSLLKNQILLTQAVLDVSVKKPAPGRTSSHYQYIPLNIFFENTINRDDDLHSTLRFSIPLINDGTTSFKSDVWMDSENGKKYEAREQLLDVTRKNTRLVLGNQSVPLPETLHTAHENFKGRLISHVFAGGVLSGFSGSTGSKKISLTQWEKQVNRNVTFGIARVFENNTSGDYNRLAAYSLQTSWSLTRQFSLKAETTKFNVSGGRLLSDDSGFSHRLGGAYQSEKIKISAFRQTGDNNIASGHFSQGSEFRFDYHINSNRHLFLDHQNHTSHRLAAASSTVEPYETKSSTLGYSQPFFGKTSLYTSMRLSSYGAMGSVTNGSGLNYDRSLSFRLSRHFSHINLSFERQTGIRSNNLQRNNYSENRYSLYYQKNRFTAGVEQSNVAGFDLSAWNYSGSNLSASLGYATPDNKNNFQITWATYDSSNQLGGSDADTQNRFGFVYDTRFDNGDTLRVSYEKQDIGGQENSTVRLIVSKSINFKIPYMKYGSVSGVVFEDRNHNGAFDEADVPLPNVRISAGKGYSAKTGTDGVFYLIDMQSGEYRIEAESGSIPSGYVQASSQSADVTVRSGKRAVKDFALQRVYRISGQVTVDRSDYLSSNSISSPGQIKLILVRNGDVAASAITGHDGLYFFEGVTPGKYDVIILQDWLPEGAEIYGHGKQTVDFTGVQDLPDINFTIGPGRVPLSVTQFPNQ